MLRNATEHRSGDEHLQRRRRALAAAVESTRSGGGEHRSRGDARGGGEESAATMATRVWRRGKDRGDSGDICPPNRDPCSHVR